MGPKCVVCDAWARSTIDVHVLACSGWSLNKRKRMAHLVEKGERYYVADKYEGIQESVSSPIMLFTTPDKMSLLRNDRQNPSHQHSNIAVQNPTITKTSAVWCFR
jgi:hypothetical protein